MYAKYYYEAFSLSTIQWTSFKFSKLAILCVSKASIFFIQHASQSMRFYRMHTYIFHTHAKFSIHIVFIHINTVLFNCISCHSKILPLLYTICTMNTLAIQWSTRFGITTLPSIRLQFYNFTINICSRTKNDTASQAHAWSTITNT